MQLFGIPFSPFVRKVMLVGAEKGVTFDYGAGGPGNLTPDFIAASPFKKIPAIRDGQFTLADSTAICAYLDAKYPDPAVYPLGPELRGRAVWFEEVADTIILPAAGPVIFNRFVAPKLMGKPGDEAAAKKGEEALMPLLEWLEGQIPASGWILGSDYSIADISIATTLRTLAYVDIFVDATQGPKTAAWYARVAARPAWQQVAAIEEQFSAKFSKPYTKVQ